MNNEQKIDKTSNSLLNIKDDETGLQDIIQPSGEDMPEDNTMELTDGMIITPSFYKKKSVKEQNDFSQAEDEILSLENNSDNPDLLDDEESILDLDSRSFLDDEDAVDLNAQTIAISKNNLNPSDFLPFTDSEKNQDSEMPFDAKTIFAPGGDLDAVEIEASDQANNTDSYDNESVFELGQEILDEEQTQEENQTIDLNADTISNTERSINKSENEKSDIDMIDDLFSDFDTKTIIAPNGDLDSLDFGDSVEEDYDINAETVIYSGSDINEISEINSEIKSDADESLFSDMNSETIIALPDDDNDDDNEPLDLDDILDASDVNASFIDATTIDMSENKLFQGTEDFSEEISDSEKTIPLDPDTFIEQTDNDEEHSVRDSTTMDGRDAEDAVISLEEAAVLDLEEDADMVLELGTEAVIEPIENLSLDLEDIQDSDFQQAAETIALTADENMLIQQDDDDILDLDILQSVSLEDQPEDKTEHDIPILTSEDTLDPDHENEATALDLIDSLRDSDESPEIEEPEDFLNTFESDTGSFSQDEDDLAGMLIKSTEAIEEPEEPIEEISAIQKTEIEETHEQEDKLSIETIYSIDDLTSSISSAQIEASLERVINKIFSERIEKILIKVVEKAVSEEISKFRASLMEDLTDEGHF